MGPSVLRSVAAAAALAAADAAHWAVIMAGSNQYYNYRHQADACHAYQIAKGHGIPESNIILLAYDDIAGNSQNPFPGKMFNKPDGSDVYAGCKISYKGEQVTSTNFLKVLRGDASAPGPVLRSTAEDRVFIFYSDHGAPGILGTPTGDYIHATDVNSALVEMHQKGMYKELLFYVEACESGSIFAGLLTAPKVKAVTAANPQESSWGFYCPPQDTVGGKEIGSCLGDEFSINWMEDADKAPFTTETIGQQVAAVTQKTQKSHVMQYGDSSFDGEPIGDFEGTVGTAGAGADVATKLDSPESAVPSRDVQLHLAYWAIRRAKTPQEKKQAEAELTRVLAQRQASDAKFLQVALEAALAVASGNQTWAQEMLEGRVEQITQAECHKASLVKALEHCGSFTDYSLRYSGLLVNLCEAGVAQEIIADALRLGCGGSVQAAACTGAKDPSSPGCYQGSAGAFGITETVRVDLKSFAAGKGTVDFTASGIRSISCLNKAFTKSGQQVTLDVADCLPSTVTVKSALYCSDTDTLQVAVSDSTVPIPITATLSKVACSGSEVVV